MTSRNKFLRLAALCIALLIVGAQLHFCADFGTSSSGAHICQVCATAGHAVVAQAVVADFSPSVSRIETAFYQAVFFSLSFEVTSPRAPPSV